MISIFLFYDEGHGKQSLYTSKEIKHCNVICFDGRDFILVESQHHGIRFKRIRALNCVTIVNHFKRLKSITHIIVTHCQQKKNIRWFPFWIRSCNEICRHSTGLDIGLTLNPTHLIKKLLKYNNRTNYEILYVWSKKNVVW